MVSMGMELLLCPISEYMNSSKEAFNAFQTVGLFETTYQIAKRIGIDVSVKHYFTPIYKEDLSASSSRYNSISFEVVYTVCFVTNTRAEAQASKIVSRVQPSIICIRVLVVATFS